MVSPGNGRIRQPRRTIGRPLKRKLDSPLLIIQHDMIDRRQQHVHRCLPEAHMAENRTYRVAADRVADPDRRIRHPISRLRPGGKGSADCFADSSRNMRGTNMVRKALPLRISALPPSSPTQRWATDAHSRTPATRRAGTHPDRQEHRTSIVRRTAASRAPSRPLRGPRLRFRRSFSEIPPHPDGFAVYYRCRPERSTVQDSSTAPGSFRRVSPIDSLCTTDQIRTNADCRQHHHRSSRYPSRG